MAHRKQVRRIPKSVRVRRAESASRYRSPTPRTPRWVEFSYDRPLDYPRLLTTRSHEIIRKWANQRCAVPAIGRGVSRDGGSQVLRFRFEAGSNSVLKEVPWEEWFEIFDVHRLVFIFRDDHQAGALSRFFCLSKIREAQQGRTRVDS